MKQATEILFKEINIKELIKITEENIKKYVIEISLIVNILFTLIGSYMFMKNIITYKYFAICQILLMFYNYLIITYYLSRNKINKAKKSVYIFIFLIFISGVISTLFAKMPRVALVGTENRYEGILAITYYLSVMILATFEQQSTKKIIVNIIVFTGIIQAIYGICQAFDLPYIYDPRPGITQGFITNPNFYGTYILMCLIYAFGLFLEENKLKKKIFYVLESIILMISLLMCNTTSVVIGLIFVFGVIFVYAIKKRYIFKLLTIFVVIVGSIVFTTQINKSNVIMDLVKTTDETKNIIEGNLNDNFGSHRMFLWKKTVEIIPKYLIKRSWG